MGESFPRPIPDCYWVEPGRLLAGEHPGAKGSAESRGRLRRIVGAGITFFLDLTHEGELESYAPWLAEDAPAGVHRRMPIRDMSIPSAEEMTRILDAIDAALEAGRGVYVHCWGGVGRTGTVVGCHLVRRGMTGEQALAQLAEWWKEVPRQLWHPVSPETDEQREMIRNWGAPSRSLL